MLEIHNYVVHMQHSPVYESSRPKYAVSQRLMTSGEGKRPEANLLIRMSQYALQCHKDMSSSMLADYQLVAD